jgi:hypothetical protein
MSSHDSFSNISLLASLTSSESAHASKNLSNDCMIRGTSTDSSVVLKSLYDARTDCALDKFSLTTDTISKPLYKPMCCNVIKDHTSNREDVLDMIGIHGELWLSLSLNMIPTVFISSLIDHSSLIATHTRFLDCHYSSEEKSVSNQQNIVPGDLPKNIPKTIVTHMITS